MESNGIHPRNLNVNGVKSKNDVETDDNRGMSDNSKKAMNLTRLMKQYKELALTAREVVHLFVRQVEGDWNRKGRDLVEWNEKKGDDICQIIDLYEGGIVKLKRCLYALIESSDEPLFLKINNRDLEELEPSFHRLLWSVAWPPFLVALCKGDCEDKLLLVSYRCTWLRPLLFKRRRRAVRLDIRGKCITGLALEQEVDLCCIAVHRVAGRIFFLQLPCPSL